MDNLSSNKSVYDTSIRLLIIIGIVILCILILSPFVSVLLWSVIFAIALYPLHKKFSEKIGGKPKLASVIIIISILLVFILPSGILIKNLIGEVTELKKNYESGNLVIPPPSEEIKELPVIGGQIYDIWNSSYHDAEKIIVTYKDWFINTGKTVVSGILSAAGGLFQIILSLIIAGVLLSNSGTGESIRKFLRKVGGNMGDEIADIIFKTIGSVVKGVIGEALVLSLLMGIVILLAGIPYAGIWALVCFVFAIIQLPVYVISVPMMIYCFAVKDTMPAIFWTIMLLLVSLSDNVLTPMMLGKNAPVPMPVIFLGVIGGCVFFGFIGLFTGAVIMSVGYTLLIKWINPESTEITA